MRETIDKPLYFKIWYIDKEIVGYNIDDWSKAPYDDVLVIVEYFGDMNGIPLKRITNCSDWYWMTPNGNVHGNGISYEDKHDWWVECEFPTDAIVKRGKWTTDEQFERVMIEARDYQGE